MSDTPNLGLPYIDGGQAQKHVTHNEALRMLDAAIQIAVLDRTRTVPPATPVGGQRHVVAAGATGAWSGHAQAIVTWQDGAWAFLAPKAGWCIWSVADDGMLVFDGALWRAVSAPSLDNVPHLGINTTADAGNLLSVTSNAALLAAITTADGGSGDVRLQLSKEDAAGTASVLFASNHSGRAEFGLVGGDVFKLKVSADGTSWVEAITVDQASGNTMLPRGLALNGVAAPATITANQNDYAPAGLGHAAVLQISSDAARSISGLAGGTSGRVIAILNVGSQQVTLLDESVASLAANRFMLGGSLTIAGKQAALLRYDATAARWLSLGGGLPLRSDTAQALTPTQQAQALANLGFAPECGRLTFTSATALKFAPFKGDLIKINGGVYRIPAAGIAGLGNAGVVVNGMPASNCAASTLYYVYAFVSGGVVTADFSTTAHGTSATMGNVGTEIKSGDDSRSLIGMVYTNASGQFQDSATFCGVLSWFNRRNRQLVSPAFTSGSITATYFSEISTSLRLQFLVWSDENWVSGSFSGSVLVNGGASNVGAGLGLDGVAAALPGANAPLFNNSSYNAVSASGAVTGLVEGLHYLTALGGTNNASLAYQGVCTVALTRG